MRDSRGRGTRGGGIAWLRELAGAWKAPRGRWVGWEGVYAPILPSRPAGGLGGVLVLDDPEDFEAGQRLLLARAPCRRSRRQGARSSTEVDCRSRQGRSLRAMAARGDIAQRGEASCARHIGTGGSPDESRYHARPTAENDTDSRQQWRFSGPRQGSKLSPAPPPFPSCATSNRVSIATSSLRAPCIDIPEPNT